VTDPGTARAPSLVVFADDWGRHPSSCQHLVRRLRDHYRVLWVNSIGTRQVRANALTLRRGIEKLGNWRRGVDQVGDNMWVADLPMLPGLGNRVIRSINGRLVSAQLARILGRLGMAPPLVLTTLPYTAWLIRNLRRRGLVYYCTDDYSHWPSADGAALRQADRELSAASGLILAASRALLEGHGEYGRCRYFPHGVDRDHFASASSPGPVPPDLDRIPSPRIGFFGLVYEKIDFELLRQLAGRFGGASLVMIGPVACGRAELAGLPNVHFLGARPYEELPRYISGLDVLLLPYVDDPMIRQSGPLKLRECLATGKPTVSVDVPEVRVFRPHVRVAAGREDFLRLVGDALDEPGDSPLREARRRAVEQDGWDRRADALRAHLSEIDPGRAPALPH